MPGPAINFARGGAAPVRTVYGLTGWDGSNLLASAFDVGLRGHVSGHWLRLLHTVDSQSTSATRFLASSFSGSAGNFVFTSGLNASLTYRGIFTGALSVDAPALAITAGHVGKLIDSIFVWDQPAGRMRHYHQGVEVGTGTVTGLAYLVAVAGQRFCLGVRSNGVAFADLNSLYAVEGGDGFVPSAAEALAAHAETVARVAAGSDPFRGTSGATGLAAKVTWSANCPHTWNTPVILDDTAAGNQDLSMVAGSASGLALATHSPVTWAP